MGINIYLGTLDNPKIQIQPGDETGLGKIASDQYYQLYGNRRYLIFRQGALRQPNNSTFARKHTHPAEGSILIPKTEGWYRVEPGLK